MSKRHRKVVALSDSVGSVEVLRNRGTARGRGVVKFSKNKSNLIQNQRVLFIFSELYMSLTPTDIVPA